MTSRMTILNYTLALYHQTRGSFEVTKSCLSITVKLIYVGVIVLFVFSFGYVPAETGETVKTIKLFNYLTIS